MGQSYYSEDDVDTEKKSKIYLVSFNSSDFLVTFNKVTNLWTIINHHGLSHQPGQQTHTFRELLQSALRDGFRHLGNLNNFVG